MILKIQNQDFRVIDFGARCSDLFRDLKMTQIFKIQNRQKWSEWFGKLSYMKQIPCISFLVTEKKIVTLRVA